MVDTLSRNQSIYIIPKTVTMPYSVAPDSRELAKRKGYLTRIVGS